MLTSASLPGRGVLQSSPSAVLAFAATLGLTSWLIVQLVKATLIAYWDFTEGADAASQTPVSQSRNSLSKP